MRNYAFSFSQYLNWGSKRLEFEEDIQKNEKNLRDVLIKVDKQQIPWRITTIRCEIHGLNRSQHLAWLLSSLSYH